MIDGREYLDESEPVGEYDVRFGLTELGDRALRDGCEASFRGFGPCFSAVPSAFDAGTGRADARTKGRSH